MRQWKRRMLGLGLPCLLAFSFDIGMTMYGQPAEYWAGDYRQANEASPFIRKLFEIHPGAAVAGEGMWAGIIIVGIVLLPEVLATTAAIAIVFGHTAGGFTWLHIIPDRRWFQSLHGLLFISAIILGLGLHWSLRNARLDDVANEPRLSPLVRWGLIGVAFAIACYMYLIPQ